MQSQSGNCFRSVGVAKISVSGELPSSAYCKLKGGEQIYQVSTPVSIDPLAQTLEFQSLIKINVQVELNCRAKTFSLPASVKALQLGLYTSDGRLIGTCYISVDGSTHGGDWHVVRRKISAKKKALGIIELWLWTSEVHSIGTNRKQGELAKNKDNKPTVLMPVKEEDFVDLPTILSLDADRFAKIRARFIGRRIFVAEPQLTLEQALARGCSSIQSNHLIEAVMNGGVAVQCDCSQGEAKSEGQGNITVEGAPALVPPPPKYEIYNTSQHNSDSQSFRCHTCRREFY